MKHPKLIFCLAVGLICLLAAASNGAESIRHKGRLVTVGDSKLQLLRVLGEPDFTEVITHAVDTGEGLPDRGDDRAVKVEYWYYFDLNSLDWEIRLENSRIADIEWER